jgi:hypothetical protein
MERLIMQTIRLRFVDHAAAIAALKAAGWLTTDPETSTETVPPLVDAGGVRCDIDMIGVLRAMTGTEGEPVMTPLPGWHVNLLWWGDGEPPQIGGEVVTPEAALREWLV